ncbi:Mob1/phocein [Kalaharituber pfeilii]|nr:Mob1/phocein [Kalaharituber pfeilii]
MAAPPSPRLPSPPPFTEVQIEGSTAPAVPQPGSAPAPKSTDTASALASKPAPATTRRIRPGSKSRDISTGPSPIPLNELDSPFQLQEHLASLLTAATTTTNADSVPHSIPVSKTAAQNLSTPPPGVDSQLWCYELTRRLTRDLNHLIVALLQDDCTSKSCPQMRAGEWQYLCAVHEPPQSCCAIDYSCHTLDHAATILTSSKYFPSRLSLSQQGGKHLSSIFRRLYRIFAHAWFQHREVFWEVEGEWGLYLFFKTVAERYNLIPEDNLTIPPEAEGPLGEPVDEKDEFSRGPKRDSGNMATLEATGNVEEKHDKNDEDEEDFGSDGSDDSDENSGSGSSGEDGEGDGGADAFDLELPMEGTDDLKGKGKTDGDDKEMNAHEVNKDEEEGYEDDEEEGEEVMLVMQNDEPVQQEERLVPTDSPTEDSPTAPEAPPGLQTGGGEAEAKHTSEADVNENTEEVSKEGQDEHGETSGSGEVGGAKETAASGAEPLPEEDNREAE